MRFEMLALVLMASGALAQPLVGQGVGNADTFISEGSKQFNKKQYAKAVDNFLKATRARPATVQTYVQLARAQMLGKQLQRACYAYRVYLKATPDSPDRKKAVAESDQCERQLKAKKKLPPDPAAGFVDQRAEFFAALDESRLLGEGSASATFKALVTGGYLSPDLGDMAQRLGEALVAQAEATYARGLAGEQVEADSLKSARPLYETAHDVGVSAPGAKGKTAFLEGLAALDAKNWRAADTHFAEASKADADNHEYAYYRAVALLQLGERKSALDHLEQALKDDPRTAVLRAALALSESPATGAAQFEQLLFDTRNPKEK